MDHSYLFKLLNIPEMCIRDRSYHSLQAFLQALAVYTLTSFLLQKSACQSPFAAYMHLVSIQVSYHAFAKSPIDDS